MPKAQLRPGMVCILYIPQVSSSKVRVTISRPALDHNWWFTFNEKWNNWDKGYEANTDAGYLTPIANLNLFLKDQCSLEDLISCQE